MRTGPVRIAVVGVGYMGERHAEKTSLLGALGGDVSLAGVADIDSRKASRIARELGFAHHLRTDSGVAEGGIPVSVLEDACEALIGAVYLDGGFATAAALIERLWTPLMTVHPPSDAKTELQEWVQARGQKLPVYKTVTAEGPPHAPVFTVEAAIDGLEPVRDSAGSKRAAERAAAAVLLELAKADRG